VPGAPLRRPTLSETYQERTTGSRHFKRETMKSRATGRTPSGSLNVFNSYVKMKNPREKAVG
jgi:hypothetical protein